MRFSLPQHPGEEWNHSNLFYSNEDQLDLWIARTEPGSMSTPIRIFDTTLRDGEQACGCSMTVPEKARMAALLADLGVDILEAGFPAASDGEIEAVARIAREVRGPIVAGLARATVRDLEAAARSLQGAARPRIHTFIATSPIHREVKLRMTQAEVLDRAAEAVRKARSYVDDVEFSAEDATRTEPGFLVEVAKAVVAAGASTVNIPDTVGWTVPEEFGALIAQVVLAVGDRAVVSVHCHNDLGLATANALAGVSAGARQVECTINGIGERTGNASLEEIVMTLATRADRLPFHTGIRTEGLYPASRALVDCIGWEPQPNKAIVGANAFAHEAGIHQDGMLKSSATYEIFPPERVGVSERRLVLGKHSGRNALRHRAEALGLALDDTAVDALYARAMARADRAKGLTDGDLLELAKGLAVTA
jgi:2-isopropylmalate synthase